MFHFLADPEAINHMGGDLSGHGDLRCGGHDYALPPALQISGVVWDFVVHAQAREGGEVPYGLLTLVVTVGY